jgi:DNA (cytosine-5)-methyltransferase 1
VNGTLRANGKGGPPRIDKQPLVAAPLSHGSNPNSNAAGRRREDDENLVAYQGSLVRRLTLIECERLQALPDGWTNHGPDTRRYAALGDAVTATVAEWIGRRMLSVS